MQINQGASWAVFATMLCMAFPAHSQNPPASTGQRELIYCADKMTHEEREAYRASMRAARTLEEKAALRQAHQLEMQSRPRPRGGEGPCEPLRLRGGRGR